MSKKYNMIKKYYEEGRWSAKWVADAVGKKMITTAEYQQITGEEYIVKDTQ